MSWHADFESRVPQADLAGGAEGTAARKEEKEVVEKRIMSLPLLAVSPSKAPFHHLCLQCRLLKRERFWRRSVSSSSKSRPVSVERQQHLKERRSFLF